LTEDASGSSLNAHKINRSRQLGRNAMTDHSRRDIMRALAVAGGSFAAGSALAAPALLKLTDISKQADVACLYHCDFGDPARFSQMLDNISNHYAVYGADPFQIEIVIVAHGAGVKFFLSSLENTPWSGETIPDDVFPRLDGLSKNGLRALLCNITFTKRNLDRENIRKADFIHLVPSGVATVAALQTKGFSYLKVG
jgi:intracellular sulfur oxidation DsrE/DsrF family protein